MQCELVKLLKCPACDHHPLAQDVFSESAQGGIVDGVLWCEACCSWFPIEDELLELLIGDLAYHDDRARFWAAHADRLKALGLDSEPRSGTSTGPTSELQVIQQEHFDWYAGNDTQTYSAYERTPFWVSADKVTYASWLPEARSGGWVLDVGCAQGRSTFKLMDLDLNIVAFDVSKPLVRQALGRYREGRYRARASFFAADALRFPFVNAVFDHVLIYGVLHHLPEPKRACQEVARVLRPNGIYWGSENNETVFRTIFDWLQKLWPQWHEKAGPEAIISAKNLGQWFHDTGVHIGTTTSIFLPPHLVNMMSETTAYRFLTATDRVAQAIPLLKNNGGLILIRGVKQ